MTVVPEEFVTKIRKLYGAQGDEWVQTLPELLRRCEVRFDIVLESPLSNLSWNLVLNAANDGGTPVVLKLGLEKEQLAQEASVLNAYAECGAIKVFDFDYHLGALLLERVHPGMPLSAVEDDQTATEVFCDVFRRLHHCRPTGNFSSITEHFAAIERYRSQYRVGMLPPQWVERAEECLAFLISSTHENVLLHGDLHHENILRDREHEWLVIDPKGIVGDLHFDAIQYLLNYRDRGGDPDTVLAQRIAIMSHRLNLDPRRIAMWGLAKGVLDACWILEDGGTDWYKSVQITECFANYLDR